MPTIWSVNGSLGLYQDPEASTSSPPGDGCATDSIHRRYSDPGRVPGASKEPCGGSGVPLAVPRFQSKPESVGPRTSLSDGFPGLYGGHSPHGAEAPTGEIKKDSCGVTIHGQRGPGVRQSPGQAGGQDECNISGDPTSPTILSAPTDVSTPQVGQYHSNGIHKQPGRDSLQGFGRLSEEPVDVVPGEEYPHHSPTPSSCSECDSRCGVSDYDRSVRLAAESGDIQQDVHFRSHRSGHVCITSDSSVPSLFQLVARSLCSSNRCIPAGLVSSQGVRKPTVERDRSGSVQSTDGQGSHCPGGTKTQPWYLLLLQILVAIPHLINHHQTMLNRGLEDLVPQLAM